MLRTRRSSSPGAEQARGQGGVHIERPGWWREALAHERRDALDCQEPLVGHLLDYLWLSFVPANSQYGHVRSWRVRLTRQPSVINIVGRGRLGGISVGVVVTEVRTSEKIIPADPATPASQGNLTQQAGQVWFPGSAHKTAAAIKDFKGEDLPLFILTNWRGFSGGQRGMFDEVLKFGAAIVDGLVNYEQPVFVYISPSAELRGGT
ncbi:hypothetical protein DVH05_000380 [Phytophthora capsici]|nr:hypothetical protein DVH05_000380 [Phytophthora capsici]